MPDYRQDFRDHYMQDLMLVLSRGTGDKAYDSYVRSNIDMLTREIVSAMQSRSLSEIYVGGDTLSETGEKNEATPGYCRVDMRATRADPNLKVPVPDLFTAQVEVSKRAPFIGGEDVHLVLGAPGVTGLLYDKSGKG